MRDGTWKGLPLPRGWKMALKACVREAERGEVAAARVTHALERDLRNELSAAFIRRLSAAEGDLLAGLPGPDAAERLVPGTVLERLVADRFARPGHPGTGGRGSARHALEEACGQWLVRHERHVRQHCLSKEGVAALPALRAFAAAAAAVDVASVARDRLAGVRPPRAASRRPIDMNEDLTRPG